MFELKVLSSGSQTGNCISLDDGNEILLLDVGIPIKKIKEGINFDVSRLVGAIVTHEHG